MIFYSEEPNPLCVHPIYQAYRSQDYYLGPPSQASATTSSSDHYFADQDAGNSSDYGMFVYVSVSFPLFCSHG